VTDKIPPFIFHWVPVVPAALDDAAFLDTYVNPRLMYGLKLCDEELKRKTEKKKEDE
jgi:hypothetical protein